MPPIPPPTSSRRQLSGQDINPLAVQITRLRLFIAITAARRNSPGNDPLPNLEARIVCADTLATVADAEWRPDRPGQLADAAPELMDALTATAENRARWFDAHTEEDKQGLLQRDTALRSELKLLLEQNRSLASPEVVQFAESPIYDANPKPSRADARLLFYENPWRGFDVVIGNPPYEALSKSMTAAGRKRLPDRKRYKTTKVGDLYSLFCETALALAKPDGGVVTLVVPLSVAFGRQQESLRQLFDSRCQIIKLRHYDNIPDTIFNGTPVLKTWKNSQRSTIISSVLGSGTTVISSTGLQRWPAKEREVCLTQRASTTIPKLGAGFDVRVVRQWLRIPTPEIADLVEAIAAQMRTVVSYRYEEEDIDEKRGKAVGISADSEVLLGSYPGGSGFSSRRNFSSG